MNRSGNSILFAVVLLSLFSGWQGGSGRLTANGQHAVSGQQAATSALETDIAAMERLVDKEYREVLQDLVHSPIEGTVTPRKVRVILAIVPDPRHTRLSLFFDRQVEAISQAAQDSDYVFRKAFLPWDIKEATLSPDPKLRMEDRKLEELREKHPGLLRFQDSRQGADLLVALVSERPTDGVNRDQFAEAIGLWQEYSSYPGLNILGPTFSGSLASLAELLDPEMQHCTNITALSGTVTGKESVDAFLQRLPKVHFASFQENDEAVIEQLKAFLKSQDSQPRIALLSEDETAYGREPEHGNKRNNTEQSDDLLLYFPREISQLRTAFQKEVDEQESQKKSTLPRSTLRLDFEQSGTDDDTVLPFSAHTRLSQESVLQATVFALRSHNIKTVIIRATDTLDQLFLAGYLTRNYPSARIIVLGTDLLFPHQVSEGQFVGVLMTGTYSLLAKRDEYIASRDGPNIDRIFPSSDSVGTYNAGLVLFDRDATLEEDGSGTSKGSRNSRITSLNPNAHLYEYGRPLPLKRGDRPIVSLLAVGRNGLLPVVDLPVEGNNPSTLPAWNNPAKTKPDRPHNVPVPFRAQNLVIAVLSLFYCSLLFLRFGTTSSLWWRFSAKITGAGITPFLVAALSTTGGFLLASLPFLYQSTFYKLTNAWGLSLTAMFAANVVLLSWDLWRRSKTVSVLYAVFTATMLGIMLYVGVLSEQGGELSLARVYRDVYRFVHLDSGLSTYVPLLFLLAACYWWAFANISGRTNLGRIVPVLPGRRRSFPLPLSAISARVGEWAIHPDNGRGWFQGAAFCVLLLSGSFLFRRRPIASLEGVWFDRLIHIAVLLICAVIVCECYEVWSQWQSLRILLRSLESTPLRRAFSRMKGMGWGSFWTFGSPVPSDPNRLLQRQREALACAVNCNNFPLTTYLDDADKKLNAIRSGQWRNVLVKREELLADLRSVMAEAAERVLVAVKPLWDGEKEVAETDSGNRKKTPPDYYQAEQFVAMVYVGFLQAVFCRIRYTIFGIGGMFVFVLLAINSYPFTNKSTTITLLTFLFVVIAAVVFTIYAQVHKNKTLSRITETSVDRLGIDYWIRILSFAAIPVLSLLAVHFPSVGRALFSWLEPLANAAH